MVHGKIVPGVFNSLDEGMHRALRRPIAGIYSMSNLVDFERYVDTTINVLLEQLDRRYGDDADAICDMGTWLQYFAIGFSRSGDGRRGHHPPDLEGQRVCRLRE
jgi:hypothetical protein